MFTLEFLLMQVAGLMGLLFVVLSFQKDNRAFVLKMHLGSALSFAVHFILLGAMTGAAIQIVSATRALTFSLRDKYQWLDTKIVMYVFIALFWIAGILTWQGYISLFPVVAMTVESFALWNKNTSFVRWLFLSARPGWISYNVFVGSYAGLATEIFIIVSLCTAIFRFDREKIVKFFSSRK